MQSDTEFVIWTYFRHNLFDRRMNQKQTDLHRKFVAHQIYQTIERYFSESIQFDTTSDTKQPFAENG